MSRARRRILIVGGYGTFGGRFHFHVEIRHRFTGLIVAYRGWLAPTS